MNDEFVCKLMTAAKQITRAERAMAVNLELDILDTLNIDQAVLESPHFRDVATASLRRALDHGEPIITNNIITDPAKAPVTNTNFTDLRVVVILPVRDFGAVYLDQHIRYGIIPRPTIDKIMRVVDYALENPEVEDDLTELYQQMN